MNKKIMFIFGIICIIFFLIFYYIFCIYGNNNIRNQNELLKDIFKKLERYEANIDVEVISNKNENKYNMFQIVDGENSKLVVNTPENVKGLEIEFKDGNLKITNEKTSTEKVYENYKLLMKNSLFIESFIEDYKNYESIITENEEEIVIQIDMGKNNNTYIKSKELYLNKKTELPTKLLIKDDNQKINTSIIYNDIKIK